MLRRGDNDKERAEILALDDVGGLDDSVVDVFVTQRALFLAADHRLGLHDGVPLGLTLARAFVDLAGGGLHQSDNGCAAES
jgi:hypothetical protein